MIRLISKLLVGTLASLLVVSVASATDHFVSPNGAVSGDGSRERPWNLQTALSQPASVKPGDTIWVLGGTYFSGPKGFVSSLTGTSAKPIVVRNYENQRTTLDGFGANIAFTVNGSNTWYWGLEVMDHNPNRVTSKPGSDSNIAAWGIWAEGSNLKFINMIVHDTADGFGLWMPALNTEVYGSLIYNNGWSGPDRGHGHGIYTQNNEGVKTIADNIIFQGFGEGIQIYGSSTASLKNYVLDGNTIFNSGSLYGRFDSNIVLYGGVSPENIRVTNNYVYDTPSAGVGESQLGIAGERARNLVATGNYWIGGQLAVEIFGWDGATVTGNTMYSQTAYALIAGDIQPNTTWDNNRYFDAAGLFSELNGSTKYFADWQKATGLDKNSTFTPSAPTETWIFIRPNKYEAHRANVTIFNWTSAATVAVDLSKVLAVGQAYTVQNAQDFFAKPVLAGVYHGGKISIPMTDLTAGRPVGVTSNLPQPIGPQFGVFVVSGAGDGKSAPASKY